MKKLLNGSKQKGFTVIELLFTVVILAILLAAAVPTLNNSNKKGAVDSYKRAMMSALNYARGESISRSRTIGMCPSDDGASCDTADDDWTNGWLIFEDSGEGTGTARNGIFDGSEELLRVYEYEGNNLISMTDPDDNSSVDSINWDHRGKVTTNAGTRPSRAFAIICESTGDLRFARALYIERSGRVINSRDFDDDGTHDVAFEADDGTVTTTTIECPSA